MNVYKLKDYKMAQQVIRDFPSLILIMEKQKEQLLKYKHYLDVMGPINSLSDSITLMKLKLEKCKKIDNSGGLLNG